MKTLSRTLVGLILLAHVACAHAASVTAPEIFHSLLGVMDDTVEQGEPLRILIRVSSPEEASGTIKLAPAMGAWTDGISVEITAAGGGVALARGEPVGKPDSATAELDANRIAGGLWRIPSAATERLTPGDYVLRARLVIGTGSGWTGEAAADEIALRVTRPGQSQESRAQATANRAQDALLLGDVEQAARLLDVALAANPDNADLLLVRAEAALRANNPMSALICLGRMQSGSGKGQPDAEREELLTRSRKALLEVQESSPNPPAWSWPPTEVMQPSKAQDAVLKKVIEAGGSTSVTPTPPPNPPEATSAQSVPAPTGTP